MRAPIKVLVIVTLALMSDFTGQGVNADPLSLASIRNELIRLEDTILFALIERSKFAGNSRTYEPAAVKIPDWDKTFLDFMLQKTEFTHALVRRYCAPDEYPFTPRHLLPDPILPPLSARSPRPIKTDNVNINNRILEYYIQNIIPAITAANPVTDDKDNYGSSAVADVTCLQAISRRIHYGKFVAESKFLNQRDAFTPLIQNKDEQAIMALITDETVEQHLLERVEFKALVYGSDITGKDQISPERRHIPPDTFVSLYRDFLIPFTKDVEVLYLLRRLELDGDHEDGGVCDK